MEAASAVNLINALMSSAPRVGAGIGVAGTQARINAMAAKQRKTLFTCDGAVNQFDFFMNARSLWDGLYGRLFIAREHQTASAEQYSIPISGMMFWRVLNCPMPKMTFYSHTNYAALQLCFSNPY